MVLPPGPRCAWYTHQMWGSSVGLSDDNIERIGWSVATGDRHFVARDRLSRISPVLGHVCVLARRSLWNLPRICRNLAAAVGHEVGA